MSRLSQIEEPTLLGSGRYTADVKTLQSEPVVLPFRVDAGDAKALVFYQKIELDNATKEVLAKHFRKDGEYNAVSAIAILNRECIMVDVAAAAAEPVAETIGGIFASTPGPLPKKMAIEVSTALGTTRRVYMAARVWRLTGDACEIVRRARDL